MNDLKNALHVRNWALFNTEMMCLSLKNSKETFHILLNKEVNLKGLGNVLLHYKTFGKGKSGRIFKTVILLHII